MGFSFRVPTRSVEHNEDGITDHESPGSRELFSANSFLDKMTEWEVERGMNVKGTATGQRSDLNLKDALK